MITVSTNRSGIAISISHVLLATSLIVIVVIVVVIHVTLKFGFALLYILT